MITKKSGDKVLTLEYECMYEYHSHCKAGLWELSRPTYQKPTKPKEQTDSLLNSYSHSASKEFYHS